MMRIPPLDYLFDQVEQARAAIVPRYIDGGSTACLVRRRTVGFGECLACPRLVMIEEMDGHTVVRCRGLPDDLFDQ